MNDLPHWLVRIYCNSGDETFLVEPCPERSATLFGSSWLEDWNGRRDVLHCEVIAANEADAIKEAKAEKVRRQAEESQDQESL